MSSNFDSRRDCPAVRAAQKAYTEALLSELLPAMRMAARGAGYALAVHGSLSRDIDLVAVPWTVNASGRDDLLEVLIGAIASVAGNAVAIGEWGEKPHGRFARTIVHGGHQGEIDLSVMSLKGTTDEV